jgi:hypothetical protein
VTVLRNCAVCGAPIESRRYQDDSARACGPGCAKTLAMREHPEDHRMGANGPGYWKKRLTGGGGSP